MSYFGRLCVFLLVLFNIKKESYFIASLINKIQNVTNPNVIILVLCFFCFTCLNVCICEICISSLVKSPRNNMLSALKRWINACGYSSCSSFIFKSALFHVSKLKDAIKSSFFVNNSILYI